MSLRILYLLTQDLESPSGLGRYAPLAQELARRGHRVTIATLHSDYSRLKEKKCIQERLEIRYVAPMHVKKQQDRKTYYSPWQLLGVTAWASVALLRAVSQIPADIIHIGKPHPMNSLAGLLGKFLKGASTQIYLDCDDYEAGVGFFARPWQKKVIQLFENRVPLHVDYVTTHTDFMQLFLQRLGVSQSRIFYLPNGVDRRRFLPPDPEEVGKLRHQLGLAERKVVLFVGSLSRPGHPVDLLLRAFARVHSAQPQSVLLLVGGGEDFQNLRAEIGRTGLGASVIMAGRVPPSQTVLYYHLGDVSVDPVLEDGAAKGRCPLKLFESWACSVPYVSADVGDRRKLLGDPPCGLLTKPADPCALADAILKILRHPDLGQNLCQLGRRQVESFYWDRLAEQMEAIYQKNQRSRLAREQGF